MRANDRSWAERTATDGPVGDGAGSLFVDEKQRRGRAWPARHCVAEGRAERGELERPGPSDEDGGGYEQSM
jgi:hypothetical protein